MCGKVITEDGVVLGFFPDCYKNKKMRDKAVDNCPFIFDSVPDQYITQEMCEKVVSKKSLILRYGSHKYKSQKMCDKAVDS